MMQLAFGHLRLAPSVFWAMTPRELAAAIAGVLGPGADAEPYTRATLAALMHRFPD